MKSATIYHITTPERWQAAQSAGEYHGDTLASQGFIHCSLGEQVAATADRYYPGQSGLILLKIETARLNSELRMEVSTGGQLFPHIYGPLNLDAVSKVIPFEPDADGRFGFGS
jgi:uncharacterized protein (DUF952 family)